MYQTSARKSGVDLEVCVLHKSSSNMQLMPDKWSQNVKMTKSTCENENLSQIDNSQNQNFLEFRDAIRAFSGSKMSH